MKELLQKLKFDRVINNFLTGVVVEFLDYNVDGVCTDIDYTYNGEVFMTFNVEDNETNIFLDDILRLLNLEYDRSIYYKLFEFIDKPTSKILIYCDYNDDLLDIEEYEKISRENKVI